MFLCTFIPLLQAPKKDNPSNSEQFTDKNTLEKEKEMGVIITSDLQYSFELHEQRKLTIRIQNMGDYRQTLVKACFLSRKMESQLTLLSPMIDTLTVLKPGDEISYIFECRAKFLGLSKEMFLFIFQGFKVIRTFHLTVKAKQSAPERNFANNFNKNAPARQDVDEDNGYISGVRPCKPPAFIAVRSGFFKIPQQYWNLVLEALNNRSTKAEQEILVGEGIPCLMESLTIRNYRDRFHALLYLEEIAQNIYMQKYDMESAILTHCGEYLNLSVPGLAEKRPSLIIGDKAIISFKWDSSKCNIDLKLTEK